MSFQYKGLSHLDMYCTLTIKAWLKLNIHFDKMHTYIVFIALNVRGGTESKYPSIVFLENITGNQARLRTT